MAAAQHLSPDTAQSNLPAGGLVDLEKELSCSICTEILYQPLTLLDCLHTFCGSCLKEWFGWQRQRADQEHERSHRPGHRRKRRRPYVHTCPSCRAVVREARVNHNVTSLLEMYLLANPKRQKSENEKQEITKTYKPGYIVLIQQPVEEPFADPEEDGENTASENEEDRRLLRHVQDMSLRDMDTQARSSSGQQSHRHHARNDSHGANNNERRRRQDGHERSRSRQIPLGHQASLRSLLNPHDSEEMKEEIMRQIAEEGLLDDVDWDNMRAEQEDEISERIAQAYKRRRRRRSRSRAESHRREGRSREPTPGSERPRDGHVRSRSASAQAQPGAREVATSIQDGSDASLPPVSRPHLVSAGSTEANRHHRRSSSHNRLALPRAGGGSAVQQAATRSATDLSNRPQTQDPRYERPSRASHESRRSTDPDKVSATEQWRRAGALPTSTPRTRPERRRQSQPSSAPPDRTTFEPSPAPEPVPPPNISVSCDRCGRQNIQYDLHYTCTRCGPAGSTYDLCIRCYRSGQGCLHWFGFGHAAWERWERRAPPGSEPPHVLRSQKYLHPEHVPTNASQSTSSGPLLELGVFCDVCHTNANSCYWHCPHCNEGEWGYCHRCVNQARHCVHPLLPMSLQSPTPTTTTTAPTSRDRSPHAAASTPAAQLTPIVLPTTCNICQQSIATTSQRLHCPDCSDGDYDMCMSCYDRLNPPSINTPRNASRKCPQGHRLLLVDFTTTNGASDFAWRRVLEGHSGAWVPEGLVPPSEGQPHRAETIWPWILDDGVKDEIGFPKGAIVEDVVPINDEFSWGVYCRRGGYFPSAYVRHV